MARRMRKTVVSGAVALVVAGATVFAGSGAANAAPDDPALAPGHAETVGAASQFLLDLDGVTIPLQQSSYGELVVDLPGQDESATSNAVLFDVPGVTSLTAGLVASRATSTRDGVLAQADVESTTFTLFGLPVLGLDRAAAEAQCVAGEAPEAGMITQGLTVLGVPVTLDESNPQYAGSVPLGPDTPVSDTPGDVVDLTGLDLNIAVIQEKVVTDTSAVAISLLLAVEISGSLGSTAVDTVVSTVQLASAGCMALSPLSLTSLSALSGPTAGGQAVTITGTGFTSGTTVDFGGAAAADVVVNETGTSLTAVTPAHAAGDITVTVTTSSGSTAALPYTYVAPVAPPNPGDRPQLAESGADPTLPLGVGALLLLAGAGSLIAARRRA